MAAGIGSLPRYQGQMGGTRATFKCLQISRLENCPVESLQSSTLLILTFHRVGKPGKLQGVKAKRGDTSGKRADLGS